MTIETSFSNFHIIKGLYTSMVFIFLVPRCLLFPHLFKERYLTTALYLLLCFAGNLFVLTFYLPAPHVPPFYEALFNPAISFWFAVVLCAVEQDHPGYFKDLDRR